MLAFQFSPTVCCVATPVPDTLIVAGEFVALLAICTEPATAPAAVGANCTVTVTDWFGLSVSPELTPLAVKPAPLTFTADTVTLALPVFVSDTLCEALLPSFTLPKLKLDPLKLRVCVAATPVPLSAIESGEFCALLVIVAEPVIDPAAVGAKLMLNVVFEFAANVIGSVKPVTLKPAPANVSCEIVTDALPVFVRVIVCEFVVPVVTLPNATVEGDADSVDCIPVPVSAIVSGEFGALLTTEMLPLAAPAPVGANFAVNDAFCPAAIVIGVVTPDMLNPVPATVTAETVTLPEPPFVNVIVWELLLPMFTLPKLSLAGEAVKLPCVPVPLNAIVSGEFGALLATEMLPLAVPAAVGANFAVKVAFCPAAIVSGVVTPEIVKPVPDTFTADIDTLPDPALVSVIVCELLLPTFTLPKLSLAGEAVKLPCVPVPLNAIVSGEFGALLATEMLPEALPELLGANVALIVADWPAVKVNGVVTPEIVKPVPVTFTAETVTLAVPLFFKVIACALLLPTFTLPKLSLAGEAPSCACVPVPLNASVKGEFGPLFAIEMLPLATPAVVGAN